VTLPGGNFPIDGFEPQLTGAAARYPFVPGPTLRRLLRAYGTRIDTILNGATSMTDLGQVFGADLTEAELRYLLRSEWARTADDVVWRRGKLGLRLSPQQIAAIDAAMQRMMQEGMASVATIP
jgi:glycerol-3-phosphate dehydrogenase